AAAPAGPVAGSARLPSVRASGTVAANYTGSAANAFQLTALSASGTVADVTGPVGSGPVALTASAQASVTGPASYSVSGTGTLAFYGPAESSLGVAGTWDSYTATVTGSPTLTLTVPAGALTLNGSPLPAGTYTITTSSATLSGSGPTT